MKITIGGQAGVGKGTIGQLLAEKYKLQMFSAGGIFREMAKTQNMTLEEFHDFVEKDANINLNLEEQTAKIGKENDNFLFDGRLAWLMIPDSIKVLLVCDIDARIQRIALREHLSIEEARGRTHAREALTKSWYKKYYNIDDCTDPKYFDVVVDTTHLSPQVSVLKISEYIENHKS